MRNIIAIAVATTFFAGAVAFSGNCCGDGYKSIFNGEDLTGWTDAAGWVVEDEALKAAQGGQNIWTDKEYESFDLRFEFMVGPGGNSGVFFRRAGLEVQVLDDYADRYANLRDWQYCGALYNLVAPSERVSKPAGEWQKMRIRLDGQDLTVWLNETKIVEADFDELDGHAGLKPGAGRIGFQNYGTLVKFRNIEIKEL